jgi:hypothetical protein
LACSREEDGAAATAAKDNGCVEKEAQEPHVRAVKVDWWLLSGIQELTREGERITQYQFCRKDASVESLQSHFILIMSH